MMNESFILETVTLRKMIASEEESKWERFCLEGKQFRNV
jgi:hypothetical protein